MPTINEILTQTDEIQDPRVHLPFQTPVQEITEVENSLDFVDGEAANPATGGDTGYEFAPIIFAGLLKGSENPWSFARLYRQAIIVFIVSIYSIAISIGRYVDDAIKKKYRAYHIKMVDFPVLSTTVTMGGVNRYMPLGWYAFFREIVLPDNSVARIYGPINFIYVENTCASTLDPRYSGIHVEPSPGVVFDVVEL